MQGLLETSIALFVIMDPIGNLPFFISMTKGMPRREIRRNAGRSILTAGILLFLFLFLGIRIFDFFSIDLDSFQIAGGIILLVMGILYIFGMPLKIFKSHSNDLSVPVGTPLLTGPGAITTTMILVKEQGAFVTAIAAFLTLLATWLILMNSFRLYKMLGEHWTNIISRIMGIILAAIAVKYITNGVVNVIKTLI